MKRNSASCRFLKTLLLSVAPLCIAGTVSGNDEAGPDQEAAVALSDSKCGSACIMVFGKVGETFHYEVSASENASFTEGLNAMGDPSSLPRGLHFDAETLTVEGVPERAGFHEFVLLSTERGVTRERVVLIDIQDAALSGIGAGYASHFLSGVR